jgi:hypothetical protein
MEYQALVTLAMIRVTMIAPIHEEIGHFGGHGHLKSSKNILLAWSKKSIKTFVKTCEKCYSVRQSSNMKSGVEEMKNIMICDLFYRVAFDTTRPLPETKC